MSAQDINERSVEFFPEALSPDGVRWSVVETDDAADSAVSLRDHIALIPKARTRAIEQIRFHELAHVAYTDDHDHESAWLTQLCKMLEEYRIDLLMAAERGLPLHHRFDDFDYEARARDLSKDVFPTALEWLQYRFAVEDTTIAPDVYEHWQMMASRLPKLTQGKLEQAVSALIHEPTPEVREREARKLLDHFQPTPPQQNQPPPVKNEVRAEINRQKAEEQEIQRQESKPKPGKQAPPPTPEKRQEMAEAVQQRQKENNEAGLDEDEAAGTGGCYVIGNVEIHDHTKRTGKATMVRAPFTQTGKGITPEFMERWCVDGRVYRTEHKGGVIVLDCSGSMRPNWALITQKMHEFPNLVVLSYQGLNETSLTPDPTTGRYTQSKRTSGGVIGRICIHAKAGKIDPVFVSEPGVNGGNYVDVEALEFGSKFRGPRIWMSDGRACGGQYDIGSSGYSNPHAAIQDKVREVMRRQHYVRLGNLDDALDYLQRSRSVEYYLGGLPRDRQDVRKGRR